MRQASELSNSTSEEAFEQLPNLSFKRWIKKLLLLPSGKSRGSRKQDSPPGAWAKIKNASHIGAEQNHLCPRTVYAPEPAGTATVAFARTSEPPCFSVIAMPIKQADFWAIGMNRES
jgi:hypothetical protein